MGPFLGGDPFIIMQTVQLPNQWLNLPDLISKSPFLQVLLNPSMTGDHTIDLSKVPIDSMMYEVISLEMRSLRRVYPDVDFNKIGGMINSGDTEMYNLGLKTLSQYSIYTHLLIPLSKCYYSDYIQKQIYTILETFFSRNISNITDRIL